MAIVVVILSFAFSAIYGVSAKQYRDESISAMKAAVNVPFDYDYPIDVGKGHGRNDRGVLTFYVTVKSDGSVGSLISNNVSITDREAFDRMVLDCLHSGKKCSVVKGENLRYLITESVFYGKVVAFADITDEHEMLSGLAKIFIFVGTAAFLIFLLISVFLANLITDPINKSIEKQNRLIADASHELKTPLTVIMANADIIESHGEENVESQKKWLSYIKSEAESMKNMICDMLTLAKSDAETSKKKAYVPTSISDAVNSSVLQFESVIFEKGKTIKTQIDDGLFVCADSKELERLTSILLDNAVKYSNENGTVEVFLYENAGKVNLCVRNSGEPIPAERVGHIFDRFYRLDDARARQTGGFGLGLAIAKDIVDKSGGKISVTSNDSIGTVFTVVFKEAKI